jgi:RNA polymerase sigma factor (sigma-70 family)
MHSVPSSASGPRSQFTARVTTHPHPLGPRWPSRGSLSANGERRLVLAAKHGDEREREKLIELFKPSISGVAYNYRRSVGVDRGELMQEGVVGLLRALKRYDAELGIPFWAYASWWVRQAMQQLVSELARPVVLSDRAQRQLARVKHAQRHFEQAHRREPSSVELAAIVGLPQSQVESLIGTDRFPLGLDAVASSDAGDRAAIGELLSDPPAEEAYERVPLRLLAEDVPSLLGALSERERVVICSRFGIGQRRRTLREVAPALGVSKERVRQIEQDSLAKLYAAADGHASHANGTRAQRP